MSKEDDREVPDAYAQILARKLVQVRTATGLNQSDIGELTGVAQGQVTRWETGKGMPRVFQLNLLVRALRRYLPWLTADWLIDPEAVTPEDARTVQPSFDEELALVLVRELGPVEARRRLIGVGLTLSQPESRATQLDRSIRKIVRRVEDLPVPDPASTAGRPPQVLKHVTSGPNGMIAAGPDGTLYQVDGMPGAPKAANPRGRPRSKPDVASVGEEWAEERLRRQMPTSSETSASEDKPSR